MKKFIVVFVFTLFLWFGMNAQKNPDSVQVSSLIGLWMPADYVYGSMSYAHTCLEISATNWKSLECITQSMRGYNCPYTISGNEIRVICHPKEQIHYKIKFLSEDTLIMDSFWVKPSGKLKQMQKNLKFVRKE